MLIRVNMPTDLVDIIMSCVTMVSTSIVFNGEALEPLDLSTGICQRDSLSPYLFILCMEFLGQLIEEKCSTNLWRPVKVSRRGPFISHLMFADDLMFFIKANHVNCSAIRDVLNVFCNMSGQTVSEAKSRVFFSPNVDRDDREAFCYILKFASTPCLGKYLCIPIRQPGMSSHEYNFILNRVKQKLVGWKANLLSLTGRAMLIQASSAAIPSYVMQCASLPDRVLDGIDQVNRNFLWGTMENQKRVHWVGWQKVTKSKEGSLGFQTARGRNISLLAKLNWRFHTEQEAPWAKVLKQKYCTTRRANATNADRLPCSQVWIAIKRGREVFNKGSMWIIRRDSK